MLLLCGFVGEFALLLCLRCLVGFVVGCFLFGYLCWGVCVLILLLILVIVVCVVDRVVGWFTCVYCGLFCC